MTNTNYKSIMGADNVYYALVTQDDSSAYAAGAPAYLAPVMTVGIAPTVNNKVQYADNIAFDTLTAEGESKISVEITGLPLDLKAVLLGKVYDASLGRMFDNGGIPPLIALGFRAKRTDGKYRYYWFLKGRFNQPQEDAASLTDSPDPKSTKLEFSAIKTTFQFPVTGGLNDSVKRVIGDTSDTVFDASTWFSNVQVPSVGAPSALTGTPTPANAASGVALAVHPIVTFNNALAGGAENGIILVRSDTMAAITCTRTLDAARKVVTLTPSGNLVTGKTYLIIVPGVTDIYGQALANAVYNFATV